MSGKRKSNTLTIMKKEFARFFKDGRMVLSTLILPGLMIYVLYTFMGSAMVSNFSTDETHMPSVYVCGLPESVTPVLSGLGVELIESETGEVEAIKQRVTEQEADVLAVFPEDFDRDVAAYDVASGAPAPDVTVYYNSASTDSAAAYQMVVAALDGYESMLANRFDVNRAEEEYDLATEEDTTGQIFAMMVPMLMMIFLFSGCMGIAPEAIAGEKERGTIATLLVTPMRRSELAVGKILSLSVIALLSALSSFLGTILSLPKLMGAASETMNASVYQIKDYLFLLLVILSTVLVIISLISIVSAFARSVKEAGTYVMPLMIVTMLLGLTSMFGGGAQESLAWYCIPLYNSVQCMNGVFSFSGNLMQILVTVGINCVFTGVMVFILARIFNSEKVMFSK
ncbi:MAG: ABC transporter permease [Lachnospiraceae bacterium]|nr:ABC transporter permease [Lachnospiraceae bacterium]